MYTTTAVKENKKCHTKGLNYCFNSLKKGRLLNKTKPPNISLLIKFYYQNSISCNKNLTDML